MFTQLNFTHRPYYTFSGAYTLSHVRVFSYIHYYSNWRRVMRQGREGNSFFYVFPYFSRVSVIMLTFVARARNEEKRNRFYERTSYVHNTNTSWRAYWWLLRPSWPVATRVCAIYSVSINDFIFKRIFQWDSSR